jgi:hypothetical protein
MQIRRYFYFWSRSKNQNPNFHLIHISTTLIAQIPQKRKTLLRRPKKRQTLLRREELKYQGRTKKTRTRKRGPVKILNTNLSFQN